MNDPFQTECRAASELLVALLTGELEPERAAFIQIHLADCAACQAECAALQQTRQQATALHLESPALDRYPEFLRRLAATEALHTQQALVRLTEPALLPTPNSEESLPAPVGLAAVVPLFGRRVMVRNGFGRGFELAVVTPQGRELLRVSATSLARVAAVAAGVSLFAVLSLAGMFLLLFPHWWRAVPEHQVQMPQPAPAGPAQHLPAGPAPDFAPKWIQTITGIERTLIVWPEGEQVMTSWLEGVTATSPQPLPPLPPLPEQSPETHVTAANPVASATDGKSFVLVREMGPAFYSWHVPVDETNTPHPAAPPIVVAQEGLMPTLAWVGDRYLFAFIRPSLTEPLLVVRALNRLGQPAEQPEVVAVATEKLDKVGWPAIAAAGPRGALFWLTESGQMQGCMLSVETGSLQLGQRYTLTRRQRAKSTPLQAQAVSPEFGGGYLVCWGELDEERFDLKLARLSEQLELQALRILISLPRAPRAYDWRVNEQTVSLLWVEARPNGAAPMTQLWQRTFNLEGLPLQPQQPLLNGLLPNAMAAFADQHGKRMLWMQRQENEPVRVMSKVIPEN